MEESFVIMVRSNIFLQGYTEERFDWYNIGRKCGYEFFNCVQYFVMLIILSRWLLFINIKYIVAISFK